VAGFGVLGHGTSGYITGGQFPDQQRDYQVPMTDCSFVQGDRNFRFYSETSNTNCNKRLTVRSDDFTAVTLQNAVFWDVATCGFCKIRRFGEKYLLHHQDEKNQRARKTSDVVGDMFLRNIYS
jgi:hypothetical protein